jgi:hypothetical protein
MLIWSVNIILNLILFLLPYYCYSGGALYYLQKCMQYILVKFTPSITLLYPQAPLNVNISAVYIRDWKLQIFLLFDR